MMTTMTSGDAFAHPTCVRVHVSATMETCMDARREQALLHLFKNFPKYMGGSVLINIACRYGVDT